MSEAGHHDVVAFDDAGRFGAQDDNYIQFVPDVEQDVNVALERPIWAMTLLYLPLGADEKPDEQAEHGQEQDKQDPDNFLSGRRTAVDDLGDCPDCNQQKDHTQ